MKNLESINYLPFGIQIQYLWQSLNIPNTNQYAIECDAQKFYLSIPSVARFLALPAENKILIEKFDTTITPQIINTWLYGTVMAYVLQYHGYIVLHGSAVLMNDGAAIISGASGAGKSTLACALSKKGYQFITDDLAVIKRNNDGKYHIIPGPAVLKLWDDALEYFEYDKKNAYQIMLKTNKYGVLTKRAWENSIPIKAFYELNTTESSEITAFEELYKVPALQTLVQNAYRYFMLKPLGKLQSFLQSCCDITNQITIHKIKRTPGLNNLELIIKYIEKEQVIAS